MSTVITSRVHARRALIRNGQSSGHVLEDPRNAKRILALYMYPGPSVVTKQEILEKEREREVIRRDVAKEGKKEGKRGGVIKGERERRGERERGRKRVRGKEKRRERQEAKMSESKMLRCSCTEVRCLKSAWLCKRHRHAHY